MAAPISSSGSGSAPKLTLGRKQVVFRREGIARVVPRSQVFRGVIPSKVLSVCRGGVRGNGISKIKERCPYDASHFVPVENMDTHLVKCRKTFRDRMSEQGREVDMLTCKYNYYHRVAAPELLYHHAHCKDAKFVPTYLLNVGPINCYPGHPCKNLVPTADELEKLYAGLYIHSFFDATSNVGSGDEDAE